MAYTINLTHRGPQVIECIDLFDEARYGADKLFLRGRFSTLSDVKEQIEISLGGGKMDTTVEGIEEFNKMVGNPLKKEESTDGSITIPTIALNRYYVPDKKFWNNVVPTDIKNPYKATSIVRYGIRLHFRDDYAYINFGCPWEFSKEYYEYFGGFIDDKSSSQDFIDNLVLFNCHFISEEDALLVLEKMFPNIRSNKVKLMEIKKEINEIPEQDIDTIGLTDENGVIFSI